VNYIQPCAVLYNIYLVDYNNYNITFSNDYILNGQGSVAYTELGAFEEDTADDRRSDLKQRD